MQPLERHLSLLLDRVIVLLDGERRPGRRSRLRRLKAALERRIPPRKRALC